MFGLDLDAAYSLPAGLQVELARLGWGRDDPAFRQVFTSLFMPEGSRALWDEFNGFKPRLRFQVDVPLPQLNELPAHVRVELLAETFEDVQRLD